MKITRSKALLTSSVLGGLYSIYLIVYFSGAIFGSDSGAEAVGGALATAMVTPHLICVMIAAILNTVAYFNNKRGLALASAILYCVGAALFIFYAPILIPMIVFNFVGYSKLKKIIEQNN